MKENEITHCIIGCAIEVHRTLGGPGLLESIYEEALAWEMVQHGLVVERQVPIMVKYKDVDLRTALRIDLLVEKQVIVECKSVEQYNAIYESQARTYLRASGLHLALVINFGETVLKNGIHRVIHGYQANAEVG